jgi:hypothetical protein
MPWLACRASVCWLRSSYFTFLLAAYPSATDCRTCGTAPHSFSSGPTKAPRSDICLPFGNGLDQTFAPAIDLITLTPVATINLRQLVASTPAAEIAAKLPSIFDGDSEKVSISSPSLGAICRICSTSSTTAGLAGFPTRATRCKLGATSLSSSGLCMLKTIRSATALVQLPGQSTMLNGCQIADPQP